MKTVLISLILISLSIAQVFEKHASVQYDESTNKWRVIEDSKIGVAWASHKESMNVTGWDIFEVTSNSTETDSFQAYGAGYLEGVMLHKSIWASWKNYVNGTSYNFTSGFKQFIVENDKWYRAQAANPTENVAYWAQVALVLRQFDGLFDGYNHKAGEHEKLTYLDLLVYELQFEIGDISVAVGEESESNPELEHCSSLIRVSDDKKKLFAAHDTWSTFTSMLRTYKHYNLNFNLANTASKTVSFSSFPAVLPSGDDFYVTSSNLVVMETTNGVFNNSLYKETTTSTVPFWIRILIANRISTSGSEWAQAFGLYNSGTYNNQWIVVDYKLFTPGQAPKPNTLWIAEQIPGYLISGDQTETLLNTGYWASYNIPYYPFVYNISGYQPLYKKYGNSYSHSECARAQIFRRDYSGVQTLDDMKRIMRYNNYQNDPLSLQDACRGISARCDLNTPWGSANTLNGFSAFGGIDSKITDNTMSSNMEAIAVSGPTWDDQPPFAWTNQWQYTPHYGQPKVFAFEFEHMKPKSKF